MSSSFVVGRVYLVKIVYLEKNRATGEIVDVTGEIIEATGDKTNPTGEKIVPTGDKSVLREKTIQLEPWLII